jgi:hypothetical protein
MVMTTLREGRVESFHFQTPVPIPGGLTGQFQSGFNVGAILNGALLNNDGAVNWEGLVHFDHRDILAASDRHFMVRGYGRNCSCG